MKDLGGDWMEFDVYLSTWGFEKKPTPTIPMVTELARISRMSLKEALEHLRGHPQKDRNCNACRDAKKPTAGGDEPTAGLASSAP